jgi:SAM-dependent methyltransferase
MTFSPEWNTAYSNGQVRQEQMTATLAHLFMNLCGGLEGKRVLELGCGVGSNVGALLHAGVGEYVGIDGSQSAVDEALAAHPKADFIAADFTFQRPVEMFSEPFDIVFDRAAISHNKTESVERAVGFAFAALKPGGIYLGSDWFSTHHSEYACGEHVDHLTRTGYTDGQFKNVGVVHFTHRAEIAELFQRFEPLLVKERIDTSFGPIRFRWQSRAFDKMEYTSAVFDLAFRKPL